MEPGSYDETLVVIPDAAMHALDVVQACIKHDEWHPELEGLMHRASSVHSQTRGFREMREVFMEFKYRYLELHAECTLADEEEAVWEEDSEIRCKLTLHGAESKRRAEFICSPDEDGLMSARMVGDSP